MKNQFSSAESALDFLQSEQLTPMQLNDASSKLFNFASEILLTKAALVAVSPVALGQFNFKPALYITRGIEPVNIDGQFVGLRYFQRDSYITAYDKKSSRLIPTADASPNYMLEDDINHTYAQFSELNENTRIPYVKDLTGRHLAAVGKILDRIDESFSPITNNFISEGELPMLYPIDIPYSEIVPHVVNLRDTNYIPYFPVPPKS